MAIYNPGQFTWSGEIKDCRKKKYLRNIVKILGETQQNPETTTQKDNFKSFI